MPTKRFVLSIALLAGFSAAARADIIPDDPEILIDVGSDSQAIVNGENTFNLQGGTGTTDFYNPFSNFITQFVFTRTLSTGLTNVFTCSSQFFLNCTTDYESNSGKLTLTFFGVNPQEPDENPFDTERGEFEGIPPLAPDCQPPHQDDAGCDAGHFFVRLTGWDAVGFTDSISMNTEITAAPEPSAFAFLAAACAGIALARRRLSL